MTYKGQKYARSPKTVLSIEDERLIREIFASHQEDQKRVLDLESRILDLMGERAEIRERMRHTSIVALKEKFGCSQTTIRNAIIARGEAMV